MLCPSNIRHFRKRGNIELTAPVAPIGAQDLGQTAQGQAVWECVCV